MTGTNPIQWPKVALEGVVIVVSILFAFAIDAWWDERNARDAEIEQLVRVGQELRANTERLQQKREVLVSSIAGTKDFISWMGPEPVEISQEAYHQQWSKFFSIGMYSVLRGAADDYLSTGSTTDTRQGAIRSALWDWHSAADDLERQYALLRAAHARINDYGEDRVPILHDVAATGFAGDDIASKFPYDHNALLADPGLESRLATYLIRLSFVVSQADSLLARQAELSAMIDAATAH